jgi:hypothetical protein
MWNHRNSVDGIVTIKGLDGPGFKSRQEPAIFPISKTFILALGSIQSPILYLPGFFLGDKAARA